MKPSVYIETTIISYLTADLSGELIIAGRQRFTQAWWQTAPDYLAFFSSAVAVEEAGRGDPQMARQRTAALRPLPLLELVEAVYDLAHRLIDEGHIPARYYDDAMHVAAASIHGVTYLATWNYRHLANAAARTRLAGAVTAAGYKPAIICTPQDLTQEVAHDPS